MLYTFDDAEAPDRHTTQYFELTGTRAAYDGGGAGKGFDVGADWGTPVSPTYKPPFEFTGALDQVTIEVT